MTYSVKELFKVHHPETVRFFLLATHYRSPIDFSDDNLAQTGKALEGFYRLFETYERIAKASFYDLKASTTRKGSVDLKGEPSAFFKELDDYRTRFLEAMDDDFNTGAAVGAMFEMRKTLNSFINDHKLEEPGTNNPAAIATLATGLTLLREFSLLLGVFRDPIAKATAADDGFSNDLMQLVLDLRAEARKAKNWPLSDMIRDRLNVLKVVVEDRPDGARWKRG